MERRDQYLDDINKLKILIGYLINKDTLKVEAFRENLTKENYDKVLLEIDRIGNWHESNIDIIESYPVEHLREILIYIIHRMDSEPDCRQQLKNVLRKLISYYDIKKVDYDVVLEEKLKQYI